MRKVTNKREIEKRIRERIRAEEAYLARKPLVIEHTLSAEHIIETRETTHGDFGHNASISQSIKEIIKAGAHYNSLSLVHRETLDMIATKISRIVSGKAETADHWLDIEGYAKLGRDACTNLS